MTASGMDETAAFSAALDELGDVNELLDYLNSQPPERSAVPDHTAPLSPAADDHAVPVTFGQDGCYRSAAGQGRPVSGDAIPAQALRGVDIQTVSGDVSVSLSHDKAVHLAGDVDKLEIKVTENGVLAIRQGRTAVSSFLFRRGFTSADVELYLPKQAWEFLQVTAASGDVTVSGGLDLGRLSVRTASGDLKCRCAACDRLVFQSASGDLDAAGLTGAVQAETMSGDLCLACSRLPRSVQLTSQSGDCTLRLPDAAPFTLQYRTASGDFTSQFPLKRTSRGAIYGDGGAVTYAMRTVSGDLRLERC